MNSIYLAALESIRANSLLATWLGGMALACILSLYLSPSINAPGIRYIVRIITLSVMLVVMVGLLAIKLTGE